MSVGSMGVDLYRMDAVDVRGPAVRIAQMEVERLRRELAEATHRAEVAEAQLRRVHMAIRQAKDAIRQAKAERNRMLEDARRLADEIVSRAEQDASTSGGGAPGGRTGIVSNWAAGDPDLDQRFDDFLQNAPEPDHTRQWILRDGSG